jgi:Prion-inhibition and propagation
MESAGLTIGVVGLAGLFSTCMECFDYIQLGRTFGEDFGKCLLRLDAAKLRFSRWGEAVGLAVVSQGNNPIVLSQQDYNVAQSLLQQIADSFEDTEKIAKRYQRHAEMDSSTNTALTVYDERTDLKVQEAKLHFQLRSIALRRQKSTTLTQKARWALYEKRRFDILISDITDFVDQLVNLFSVARESEMALCQAELYTIKDEEDIVTLRSVVEPDDNVLQRCIQEELVRRGHAVTDWKAGETSDVWIGDENAFGVESKGHLVSKFEVSGSAKVRVGNKNTGSQTTS